MTYVAEHILIELENRLQSNDFKLNSLLVVTNAINSNKTVSEILDIYNYVLKEQLGIKKFVLFNKQKAWNIIHKVGIKGKLKDLDIDEDMLRFRDITFIESSHKPSLNQFDVIVPVYHKDQPLAFLIVGDVKDHSAENTINHLDFIQTLTNLIIVAIENKRLAKESIKQEVVRKELEVASEMQKLLFPNDLPNNSKLDISAKYIPLHKVSGDYYDYIQLNEDEFIVCMADVSGKGIAAAMLMANFQATIRTLFKYQDFELEDLIKELNDLVFTNANGEKFITFFIAKYNSKSRQLKYINAGHNWPLLINKKETRFLNKGCIGLGMLKEIPFLNSETIKIKPNTTLVIYTDGVVELENEDEEQFETDRLTKIVRAFYPLSMDDINGIIFGKLDEWRGIKPYVDDTAILSCRIF